MPILVSLIGTFAGGVATYYGSIFIIKKQIKDNAYTSAILIRSWLLQKRDEIKYFRKNLAHKLNLLQDENAWQSNYLEIFQEFGEEPEFFDMKITLVENLSIVRKNFRKYEEILRCLSLARTKAAQAESFKKNFNDMKKSLMIFSKKESENPLMNPEIMKNCFLPLKNICVQHLTEIQKTENFLDALCDKFQQKICMPLGIGILPARQETLSPEQLIEEL